MTKETLIKELNERLEHIQAISKDLVKEVLSTFFVRYNGAFFTTDSK